MKIGEFRISGMSSEVLYDTLKHHVDTSELQNWINDRLDALEKDRFDQADTYELLLFLSELLTEPEDINL